MIILSIQIYLQIVFSFVQDYDEPPPKLPTKQRRTSITQSPTPRATPPPAAVQVQVIMNY